MNQEVTGAKSGRELPAQQRSLAPMEQVRNLGVVVGIVLLTLLHLSDSFSYFSDYSFSYLSCPVKTMYLQIW